MRLSLPPRRRDSEPLLPMIDVVFFLIVFFMLVSTFAEPEPFAVERPEASATDPAEGGTSLFIDSEGRLALWTADGLREGDDALAVLTSACPPACGPVLLHADARAPGTALAVLVARLAAMGRTDLRLVTVPP